MFQIFRTPKQPFLFCNLKNVFLLLILFNSTIVLCQDGQLDLTFSSYLEAGSSVYAITQQNDNKILIGGLLGDNYNFTTLNEDGTIDNTFMPVTIFNFVSSIAVNDRNEIFIAGGSPSYIKKLNQDGSEDQTFNFEGISGSGSIREVKVLDNGKIIIAGNFNQIGNTTISAVARLNADGSLDSSFNLNFPPFVSIRTLEVQPDGKIIVAGQYYTIYEIFRRYLPNGSIDTSFNGDESYYIYDIKYQDNGKIMIAGPFSEYSGITRHNVARLNNDGTLDTSFDSYNLPQNGTTYTIFNILVLDDGNYILSGSFNTYDGLPSKYLAKIEADGTINSSFDVELGPDYFVWDVFEQNDGKILIGGDFTNYNGTPINGIARLTNTSLSTDNYELKNWINIYPTVFEDKLNIDFNGSSQDTSTSFVEVFSLSGNLILSENILDSKSLYLDFLNSGTYILKITDKAQFFATTIIKR